ncbi:MAG: nucleotidyltransferase domain-containing protein [Ignavibacteriaceae bacterium]|nr:nucleotidyltransferase domain-containing protein [Ignavibacteriaceae bacterium]
MADRTIEDASRIAHEYFMLLLKAGLPVKKVILFGSYSRKEQNESSDIDIAVVLKEYHKDKFETRLELMKYAREFEDVIEPHPFLVSEFDETEPFASEILHSGIEIN